MYNKKDYEFRKKTVVNHFKKNGVTEEVIGEFCVMEGMPRKVVLEFLMDDFPKHKKMLIEIYNNDAEFYGYKKIVPCDFCNNPCGNSHCVTRNE